MVDGSGVVGAAAALIGAVVMAGVTLAVNGYGPVPADRASRRDALLSACTNFMAAVARARSLCYDLDQPKAKERVHAQLEEASRV